MSFSIPNINSPEAIVLIDPATGLPYVASSSGSGPTTNPVSASQGGTGVANNDSATTTRSGNFGLTITLTNTTSVTLPTSGTLGYLNIPQNAQTGNYTTVLGDSGKHIYHASGAGAGDTYTIDSNANVAYAIGTAITFVNMDSNNLSIAITSDTMNLAGAGTTGTRTLAQYGVATAVKLDTTLWLISGTNLT